MVSGIPYFSFKEIHLHRRQPFWVLIVVIVLLKLIIAEPQLILFAGSSSTRHRVRPVGSSFAGGGCYSVGSTPGRATPVDTSTSLRQ